MAGNSLLKHDNHITKFVRNTERYQIVRPRLHDLGYFSNRRVLSYLDFVGFKVAAYIQIVDLRADLISGLVERWRLETHTFHHPCR
ncbi:hypothetical protein J1N35_021520 [Gossypium stocksii]|uniref:Aminotransferase-like plant mobile domain-containing protein n=1 Tax=Gossypium stocksii TaxID=47602 RepID=A0A9D4A2J0_9ROSI|nr:hypothetical protein J1N35_021520 [Gossypium stocksii]